MARLVLENLSKVFEQRTGQAVCALSKIDLAIEPGECLALVGPSGSGKTTLLRVIAGFEEQSHGSVRIDGRAVDRLLPGDRDIAMVFQQHALFPHMTVYDNMAFGLRLRKCSPLEVDQKVQSAAEFLELNSCLKRWPGEL